MSFSSSGDAVKSILFALLACAPVLAHAGAPVKATITMRDPAAVEVSYAIPPACTALEFRIGDRPPGAMKPLRDDWRAADDCTALEGGRIVRKQAACTTLRLRVPAAARNVDRIYPWAYPVEQGLFVHTSTYAVTDACGAVDWVFEAPGGTVVVDGVMTAERGAHAAGPVADHMPVVLIREPFRSLQGRHVHADARFTPQTLQLLDATVAGSARQLAHDLPGMPFTVPFIVASPSTPPTWRGDVPNRTVMRLTFPPAPGPAQEAVLHRFIPHEMSHLLQPTAWNDAWQGEDESTIGEGGAEFLRVATTARLGWLDRAALKDELENAVNGCVLAADGKPWKAMRNRGWGQNPYQCGLAFYAIGLAAADTDSPLLRLRDYNRKAKQGERTDFARDIECGGVKDCQPRWLPRLAGSEALDAVLSDYARQPGALLRVTDTWSPALVEMLAFRHVGQVMRADCGGAVSMYEEDRAARIADGPTCGTLRPGMVVIQAEGRPLFEGADGLKASVAACRASGRTVLGLRDGTSVTVPCGAGVGLPAHVYAVDEARALALLR
jgi:hypothetical protein